MFVYRRCLCISVFFDSKLLIATYFVNLLISFFFNQWLIHGGVGCYVPTN
eukprot:m.115826 g.115826  ORF g.115826 m.115826 type:complete len:50 (-) comp28452_c0_seq1:303-452(-)